ncbi:LytR/AlgR family response regulator transcription factor [Flavitalea sp.]|nr:LytTR family DNA-binding domain-containing protein [Flavitalea sp.]
MILNCVVIDDEPLARECLEGYLKEVDFVRCVASGNNPVELSRILEGQSVDLIFLDIQMPMMNGIEYLRISPNRPMVIISSAYPQYALEGFQLDVLDYMVKPIVFSRFYKAVSKARDYYMLSKPAVDANEIHSSSYFFIKCDYRYEKIYFADILFIEALQNYVTIYTTAGKFLTLLYLKNLDEKLDSRRFLRVHKSYVISIDKVKAIENNEIIIGEYRIPVSRNYRDAVIGRVVNDKLWKK